MLGFYLKAIRYVLCIIFGAGTVYLAGQDIHYSQYLNVPLTFNPALTANGAENSRISANFRRQWQTVPVDWVSFSTAYEAKILKNWRAGLLIDYDKAGEVALELAKIGITVARSFRMSQVSDLNVGGMLSYQQRSLDAASIRTGNQWDGRRYTAAIAAEIPPLDQKNYMDVSIGLNYRLQTSFRDFLNVGFAFFNTTKADQSFESTPGYEANLNARKSFYLLLNKMLFDKLDFVGSILHQRQSPYNESLFNLAGKFYLNNNNERNKALIIGAGIRNDDAVYPMIALEYQNIIAGLSYDINISEFDIATNHRGGMELSFRYRFYKITDLPKKPCTVY